MKVVNKVESFANQKEDGNPINKLILEGNDVHGQYSNMTVFDDFLT